MSQEQIRQRLLVLKQWLEEGLISQEDFQHEKSLCLQRLRELQNASEHGADHFSTVLGEETGGDVFSTGGTQPTSSSDPHDLLGGRYQLQTMVGRGGMGEVWEAVDKDSGATVALKRLPEFFQQDPALQRRFRREIKVLMQLQHPNIVRLLDYSEHHHFYVMEFLRGQDLYEYLKQHTLLTPAETVELLLCLTDALEVAHEQGIVHRDLKPHNLFLQHSDLQKLKLLDFGIAWVHETTRMTHTGAAGLGSAYYMAPEQLDASMKDQIGPATDLYACGILLYEVLTGKLPQPGAPPLRQQVKKQWQKQSWDFRLSEMEWQQQIPPLERLYQRLVSPTPMMRGTLAQLKRDLEDWKYWNLRGEAPVVHTEVIKAESNHPNAAFPPTIPEDMNKGDVTEVVKPTKHRISRNRRPVSSDVEELVKHNRRAAPVPKRRAAGMILAGVALAFVVGVLTFTWLVYQGVPQKDKLLIPRPATLRGVYKRTRPAYRVSLPLRSLGFGKRKTHVYDKQGRSVFYKGKRPFRNAQQRSRHKKYKVISPNYDYSKSMQRPRVYPRKKTILKRRQRSYRQQSGY